MSDSSSNVSTVSSTDITKELKDLTNKDHIDLNDVLADLKHLTGILNNLTVVVSLYLAERGELDSKRFKIVPNPDQQIQTPQQQTSNKKEDPS